MQALATRATIASPPRAAGVAVTGRYVVRFNTDWSQSVTPGRSDVQIELIELA